MQLKVKLGFVRCTEIEYCIKSYFKHQQLLVHLQCPVMSSLLPVWYLATRMHSQTSQSRRPTPVLNQDYITGRHNMWKYWQKHGRSFHAFFFFCRGWFIRLRSFQPSWCYVICLLSGLDLFGVFHRAAFLHEPTSQQSGGGETYCRLY